MTRNKICIALSVLIMIVLIFYKYNSQNTDDVDEFFLNGDFISIQDDVNKLYEEYTFGEDVGTGEMEKTFYSQVKLNNNYFDESKDVFIFYKDRVHFCRIFIFKPDIDPIVSDIINIKMLPYINGKYDRLGNWTNGKRCIIFHYTLIKVNEKTFTKHELATLCNEFNNQSINTLSLILEGTNKFMNETLNKNGQ